MSKPEISCTNCLACCCRLEVLLISDTGVPPIHIALDESGSSVMARLEDGWCSALDRNTMKCTIYENRPWVCREFQMGSQECIAERSARSIES
jgi:Fe-S-cluster containining protein